MKLIFLFMFVFFIASFSALVSALYLIDERVLKKRSGVGLKFVSLKLLDALSFYLVAFALTVLTLALVLDFHRLLQFNFRNLTTILIWIYFGVYMILKAGLKWRGHSLAYYVLIGYGLICLNVGYCVWHLQ